MEVWVYIPYYMGILNPKPYKPLTNPKFPITH